MSRSSQTYVLFENDSKDADGTVCDRVTEKWTDDGTWAVGHRRRSDGSITFNHRTHPTLGAVCDYYDLERRDVMKRVVTDVYPPKA